MQLESEKGFPGRANDKGKWNVRVCGSRPGHARRFANPGTFTVAGEMLRMDMPYPMAGEGAQGVLLHRWPDPLAAAEAGI